jgi:hypothetical protein
MYQFVTGAVAMGYLISALFFVRFWKETADRLFMIFGIAFFLLSLQRAALTVLGGENTNLYLLRLLAFVLILVAIIDKNRKADVDS